MPKAISKAKRKKALDLVAGGMSLDEAGSKTGVAGSTIGNWLRLSGEKPARRTYGPEVHAEAAKLAQDGMAHAQIAQKMGISQPTISSWLRDDPNKRKPGRIKRDDWERAERQMEKLTGEMAQINAELQGQEGIQQPVMFREPIQVEHGFVPQHVPLPERAKGLRALGTAVMQMLSVLEDLPVADRLKVLGFVRDLIEQSEQS